MGLRLMGVLQVEDVVQFAHRPLQVADRTGDAIGHVESVPSDRGAAMTSPCPAIVIP